MITITDIAKLLGMSKSTVARVFSGKGYVSAEKREKVLECAERLGFMPNQYAVNLGVKRTNVIGIVVYDITNSFYMEIISRLSKLMKRSTPYRLILSFIEDDFSEIDCIKSLIAMRPDCILFTPAAESDAIRNLLRNYNKYALQLYGNAYENFDAVISDDEYGAYLATERLIKEGHREILLVDAKVQISTHRIPGYERALSENGLKGHEHILQLKMKQPYETTLGEISSYLERARPTAIIASSEYLGSCVLKAIAGLGKKVPEDFSFVLYDNCMSADILKLTTIAHPYDVLAKTILEKIVANANKPVPERGEVTKIKPFLIERESVRPPRPDQG